MVNKVALRQQKVAPVRSQVIEQIVMSGEGRHQPLRRRLVRLPDARAQPGAFPPRRSFATAATNTRVQFYFGAVCLAIKYLIMS